MKRTKRIASVLLALVMALSLITTAFAAGETYSITIKNDAAGHTYEAYQIFAGDLAIKDGVKTLSNIRWGSGVSAEGQAALGNAAERPLHWWILPLPRRLQKKWLPTCRVPRPAPKRLAAIPSPAFLPVTIW